MRPAVNREVGGSSPPEGAVFMVYGSCTPGCGPGGPGSTPGDHPRGVRRRWRVGPVCKTGALLRGFESLHSHATKCHPMETDVGAGAGCPAAAHNGGVPGSTPGPTTQLPAAKPSDTSIRL